MLIRGKILYTSIVFVALICIGIAIGFYVHTPVRKAISRYHKKRQYELEKQNLTRQFLNKEAPEIITTTVDGTAWSLQEQRGKAVLIFFWATTCAYSQRAIDDIKDIYYKYKTQRDFSLIGISLDKERAALQCFTETRQIPWINLYEDGKGWDSSFPRALSIHRIPSVWIIDKEGIIRGFNLTKDQVDAFLSELFEGRGIVINALGDDKTKISVQEQIPGCTK